MSNCILLKKISRSSAQDGTETWSFLPSSWSWQVKIKLYNRLEWNNHPETKFLLLFYLARCTMKLTDGILWGCRLRKSRKFRGWKTVIYPKNKKSRFVGFKEFSKEDWLLPDVAPPNARQMLRSSFTTYRRKKHFVVTLLIVGAKLILENEQLLFF